MKILLLDDKQDRIQDIEEIISEYKFELHTSHSLEDSEKKLKCEKYDLVIIDLVVPVKYTNRSLSKNAGFELVKYIYETTDNICKPKGVVIVSDNLNDIEYQEELNLYPVSIIKTNLEFWQEKFRVAIDNFMLKIKPIDVAIVTAVDVEFNAIFCDGDWVEDVKSGVLTFYRKTVETKSGNQITAVLVQAEDKGMIPASMAMSKLFENYYPQKVFMIGVSAGNPSKTEFGDIIVAAASCDYSKGSITDDETGGLMFESEPNLVSASDDLINVFRNYSKNPDITYALRKKVNMSQYNRDINIIIGLIACGPLVVKSKKITNEYIRPYNKNYLGIDMESYAIYYSCVKNNCKNFLTIKSVSDHGDKTKTHEHQEYCAKLSAQLLKHYIYNEL